MTSLTHDAVAYVPPSATTWRDPFDMYAALREHTRATGIVFAGDDVTDEDAMRVLTADDLGVRVGAGDTAATVRVESPQQVAELLGVIATERASGRE